jgi:hypothetical protein
MFTLKHVPDVIPLSVLTAYQTVLEQLSGAYLKDMTIPQFISGDLWKQHWLLVDIFLFFERHNHFIIGLIGLQLNCNWFGPHIVESQSGPFQDKICVGEVTKMSVYTDGEVVTKTRYYLSLFRGVFMYLLDLNILIIYYFIKAGAMTYLTHFLFQRN